MPLNELYVEYHTFWNRVNLLIVHLDQCYFCFSDAYDSEVI